MGQAPPPQGRCEVPGTARCVHLGIPHMNVAGQEQLQRNLPGLGLGIELGSPVRLAHVRERITKRFAQPGTFL
jgi:hypothetical protein